MGMLLSFAWLFLISPINKSIVVNLVWWIYSYDHSFHTWLTIELRNSIFSFSDDAIGSSSMLELESADIPVHVLLLKLVQQLEIVYRSKVENLVTFDSITLLFYNHGLQSIICESVTGIRQNKRVHSTVWQIFQILNSKSTVRLLLWQIFEILSFFKFNRHKRN